MAWRQGRDADTYDYWIRAMLARTGARRPSGGPRQAVNEKRIKRLRTEGERQEERTRIFRGGRAEMEKDEQEGEPRTAPGVRAQPGACVGGVARAGASGVCRAGGDLLLGTLRRRAHQAGVDSMSERTDESGAGQLEGVSLGVCVVGGIDISISRRGMRPQIKWD